MTKKHHPQTRGERLAIKNTKSEEKHKATHVLRRLKEQIKLQEAEHELARTRVSDVVGVDSTE